MDDLWFALSLGPAEHQLQRLGAPLRISTIDQELLSVLVTTTDPS